MLSRFIKMVPVYICVSLFVIKFTESAVPNKINGHIVISSVLHPLTIKANQSVTNVGYLEKDIVDVLQSSLNFTFEIDVPRNLGEVRNGIGTGLMGQFMRKEIDIFLSGGNKSIERYPYVDFTEDIFSDNLVIMIPYPERSRRSNALVAIYSPQVWWGFIAFASFAALALWWLGRLQYEPIGQDIIIDIIGLIASQGGYFKYKRFASRLIWASWCLVLVVLVNVYTGTLTSMLTAPSYHYLASSIEDVANNENIRPYLIKGFLAEDYVMGSPGAAFKTIKKRLLVNADLRVPPNSDFAQILTEDKKGLFIGSSLLVNSLIANDARKSKHCRFTLTKKAVSSRRLCFLLQKDSPLTAIFNQKIMHMQQFGIMDKVVKDNVPSPDTCKVKEGRINQKLESLRLNQLTDAISLLVIGLTSSFAIFLAELATGYYLMSL